MRDPILCGVDGSAEALVAARLSGELARCLDAPLILAHAVFAVYPGDGLVPVPAIHDMNHEARRHGDAVLRRALGELDLTHDVRTLLLVGEAATALQEAAADMHAAALVVAARGQGLVRRALLGSVSARLAARAPCPVVIVPPDMGTGVPLADGTVICGLDGSEHAEHGADVAAATAARLHRDLLLVHVLPATSAVMGDDRARTEGWEILAATARRLKIPARLVTEVAAGPVASTLADVARREHAACLVIGSRGRGPWRSALLGSISAGVVAHARCPVVVVPPMAEPRHDSAVQARRPDEVRS